MRKTLFLFSIASLLLASTVYGWGPFGHESITYRMLENPDVGYAITARGFSNSAIADVAKYGDVNMPDYVHHGVGQYENIRLIANLNTSWMAWPLDNTWVGWLCHNIADVSVPVGHSPANTWWSNSWAEDLFEAQGEAYSTPASPDPLWYGNYDDWPYYDQYVQNHTNVMYTLTNNFKNHWNSHWACKYFHVCQTDWIDPDCRRAALKLAWETLAWVVWVHDPAL